MFIFFIKPAGYILVVLHTISLTAINPFTTDPVKALHFAVLVHYF